ncbi:hypothetical protein [Streptacidiphilus fuscans]|uniref:Uncharacterized protein n=1 Tax=Streptacidiphilus fuscans TaxID=2789292 RepID=A0A931FJ49_9ACTN|nr:hypothetical protein [Streptacidiphilus fuscans]MBF9073596.1 hypothetical protein [Streptacidiphilus fuscans]
MATQEATAPKAPRLPIRLPLRLPGRGPALLPADGADAERRIAVGVLVGVLLLAAIATAVAGLHVSRAHGVGLLPHVLVGAVGLLLPLFAVHLAGGSELLPAVSALPERLRDRLAVAAGLMAVGIALVDVGMLLLFALDRFNSAAGA